MTPAAHNGATLKVDDQHKNQCSDGVGGNSSLIEHTTTLLTVQTYVSDATVVDVCADDPVVSWGNANLSQVLCERSRRRD